MIVLLQQKTINFWRLLFYNIPCIKPLLLKFSMDMHFIKKLLKNYLNKFFFYLQKKKKIIIYKKFLIALIFIVLIFLFIFEKNI